MSQRISLIGAVFAAMLLGTLIDAPQADAQLFRRLRERIQSRVQPPPPPQPTPSQSATPAPAPQSPGQTRVSPVTSGRTVTPTPAPRPATPPRPATAASPRPNTDSNQYGGSILNRGPTTANKVAAESKPARPSLGVKVLATEEGMPGLRITSVNPGSPASAAGLQTDDVIIMLNGVTTPTVAAVSAELAKVKPEDVLRVRIIRGRETEAVSVPLSPTVATAKTDVTTPNEAVASNAGKTNFGATVAKSGGSRGVVVTDVVAGSPAAAAGLKADDRIVSFDGRLIADKSSFDQEIAQQSMGDSFRLQVVRDGSLVAADVRMLDPATLAAENGQAGGSNDNSVLGGLGSVLGGLLGNNKDSQSKPQSKESILETQKDQTVRQVDFESAEPQPRPLESDPPSLKKLERPSENDAISVELAPPTQADTAESLREQIRKLEERLREIESKED